LSSFQEKDANLNILFYSAQSGIELFLSYLGRKKEREEGGEQGDETTRGNHLS
jgi:hypothetical protein